MYCINCGVKLADTEKRCPLCGVTVYHPELSQPEGEPLYPRHRYPAPEVASKAAQIVITTVLAIAMLTTLYVDRQVNGGITWSGIAAGGIAVFYIILILPFWFRKVEPLAYVPGISTAIALYLMYIDHVTSGGWFLSFALPVIAYVGVLMTVQVYLLQRHRQWVLTVLGGGFIALGALMPLMEYLIFVTFHRPRLVGWSAYPLISLALLGAMLIFLAVNRRAREIMERKFFL